MLPRLIQRHLGIKNISKCSCVCHFSSVEPAIESDDIRGQSGLNVSKEEPLDLNVSKQEPPLDLTGLKKDLLSQVYYKYQALESKRPLCDSDYVSIVRSVSRVHFLNWLDPEKTAKSIIKERLKAVKRLTELGFRLDQITYNLVSKYQFWSKFYDVSKVDSDSSKEAELDANSSPNFAARRRFIHFVKNSRAYSEVRSRMSEVKLIKNKLLIDDLASDRSGAKIVDSNSDAKKPGNFSDSNAMSNCEEHATRWTKTELGKAAFTVYQSDFEAISRMDAESRRMRRERLEQLLIEQEDFISTLKRALPVIFDGTSAKSNAQKATKAIRGVELIANELQMDANALAEKIRSHPLKRASPSTITLASASRMLDYLFNDQSLSLGQLVSAPYIFLYNLDIVRVIFQRLEAMENFDTDWRSDQRLLDFIIYLIESDNCADAFTQETFGTGAFLTKDNLVTPKIPEGSSPNFALNLIRMPGYKLLQEKIFCPPKNFANYPSNYVNYIEINRGKN